MPAESEPLSARRLARLIWCLVLLGLAARVIRYLLGFPLWQDEAYMSVNLLERSYAELLAPLVNHQVCPFLFLWVQAALTRVLGFSEYTLRLFPLICSVAGLFLFRHMAGRVLRGTALLLAVGIFAVGYPLVRYACEAKPYGCDMFASLVLLALTVEWYTSGNRRWLWILVACVPVAMGLSYPAVFTAAGISLAVAYGLWTEARKRTGEGVPLASRQCCLGHRFAVPQPPAARTGGASVAPKTWGVWICYNVVLLASFAGVYWLSIGPQSAAELAWMREYWKDIFPPLDSAVGMLKWLAVAHTSELLQYPVGGARGASTLTTVCCAAAVVFLWRRRERWLVVLCLAPLVPNLVAALAWRYPYGGSVRFVLYLAPAVCLLAGLGAAALLVRRDRHGVVQGRPAVLVLCGLLAVVGVGSIARDFARPYRTRDVLAQRDFARWFWANKEYGAEVACWETDLGEGAGSSVAERPGAAIYLCNRRIYSPRQARAEPVGWDRVSAERPLRVVRYGASYVEDDEAAFGRWLAGIQSRYDLVDRQRHAFLVHCKDRKLLYYDYVDVYEFVPKGCSPAGVWSSRCQRGSPAGPADEKTPESLCRKGSTEKQER